MLSTIKKNIGTDSCRVLTNINDNTYAPITIHVVLYIYTTECVYETGLYVVNHKALWCKKVHDVPRCICIHIFECDQIHPTIS